MMAVSMGLAWGGTDGAVLAQNTEASFKGRGAAR